ncbi:MAG: iron ABC transporter substrate-binding protein [Deltaproteobacteria bacterium]|nr:iron ABC transporter substrate-binding protein [Deltaproteobacteria bacterium]
MKRIQERFRWPGVFLLACALLVTISGRVMAERAITDMAGRVVTIPDEVTRVICSGAGCLRLLTYVQAHDRIVAVDSIEVRGSRIDARPYAIANPQFKTYPMFGEFRGHDNPELIVALEKRPQVIFKTFADRGVDPDKLQEKTGIPVVVLDYGNLTWGREALNRSIRLMGEVMGREARAEDVVAALSGWIEDLDRRTKDIPEDHRPTCYIGGLGQSGPHGFQSTEPSFAPFTFTHARNIAAQAPGEKPLSHTNISKEKIIMEDPEFIFLDVSTVRLGEEASALGQLERDPAYVALSAVRSAKVYFLLPYNSYNQNFESIIANSYYVGKVLYPEHFEDVDPDKKADELSIFLNGGPSFKALKDQFDGLPFEKIDLRRN